MKRILLAFIATLTFVAPIANAEHDPLENARPFDYGVIAIYQADVQQALDNTKISEADVMQGVVAYMTNLSSCLGFYAVTYVILTAADRGKQIPTEVIQTAQEQAMMFGLHLQYYAVAIENVFGKDKFNASTFIHSHEKTSEQLLKLITSQLYSPQSDEYIVAYQQQCIPLAYNISVINQSVITSMDNDDKDDNIQLSPWQPG